MSIIRTAFPKVAVRSPRHREILRQLRNYRRYEEEALSGKHGGWIVNRNLVTLPPCDLKVGETVAALVDDKRGREPVRVFEVGCGIGNSLRTLKSMYGDKVEASGITLTKKAAEFAAGKHDEQDPVETFSRICMVAPTNPNDPLHAVFGKKIAPVQVKVGLIEGLDLHDQDYIFSHEAMRYTFDPIRALEKIANGLALGGVAVLEVPNEFLKTDELDQIHRHMRFNGMNF